MKYSELTEEQKQKRRLAVKKHNDKNPLNKRAKKKRYNKRNPEKVREKRLLRRYGISNKDFDTMATLQQNSCAICKEEKVNPRTELVVDHNHTTSKVRQLLCNHCNQGIGLLKEDTFVLQNAIEYLTKHG